MRIKKQISKKINNYFDYIASNSSDASRGSERIQVSVICPFFNEEEIIENAILTLLKKLDELEANWELIVVNDGSNDNSERIAAEFCEKHPQLKLVSYPINRGRGYALRRGIAEARGDIIITTEIDLSWGEDTVHRLYTAIKEHPETDIVVASPHLPGGGYRNVPWKRVFFSRFGNKIIRTFMINAATMNTGMTRAYRREVIQSLPLEEDHKEFHLEVIMKAQALKYRIHEIPCILEWKSHKHEGKKVQRKSASKIKKLVVSHSLFSLFANPIRYVWGLSGLSLLISIGFFVWSFIRLFSGLVSVFTLIISLTFAVIALIFFALGAIAQQGNMVQYELWSLKQSLLSLRQEISDEKTASESN